MTRTQSLKTGYRALAVMLGLIMLGIGMASSFSRSPTSMEQSAEAGGPDASGQAVAEVDIETAATKTVRLNALSGELAVGEPVPSKPMSPLYFIKPSRYLLHSGETVRVSLTLVASENIERVMVTARSEPGTELVSKPQFFLGELAQGEESTVWFDVTVLSEGRHYVSVQAEAETPEGARFSSYAIPVETRDSRVPKQAASPAQGVYDAQGNLLRLLPASKPD